MLRQNSRILFAATFVVALLVFLMLSLEVYRAIEGYGVPSFDGNHVQRLRSNFLVASYFLVASGYLIAFLAAYFLFTKKMRKPIRVLISSLLFVAAYVFFLLVMGNTFSMLEGALLLAGIVSVVISDALADAVSGSK